MCCSVTNTSCTVIITIILILLAILVMIYRQEFKTFFIQVEPFWFFLLFYWICDNLLIIYCICYYFYRSRQFLAYLVEFAGHQSVLTVVFSIIIRVNCKAEFSLFISTVINYLTNISHFKLQDDLKVIRITKLWVIEVIEFWKNLECM